MAGKVKVWFDAEADFLEVRFFSILGVSCFEKSKPLTAELVLPWRIT